VGEGDATDLVGDIRVVDAKEVVEALDLAP